METPTPRTDREPLPPGIQHVSDVMTAVLRRRLAADATSRRPAADLLPPLELSLASGATAPVMLS